MSRALDADTVASLQQDPNSAYSDIVKALSTKTNGLLEIEFLGKSHALPEGCNVLVDGSSIAIPKPKLVQAFVVARKILLRYLKDCPDDKQDELRNATAIVLLMDSEHLTAANTRKRLIQKLQISSGAGFEVALREELQFVDSYLTSRLHRHTKSPTLWGHRRWILSVVKSAQSEHNILRDLQTVVLVAAERHPRNYYAWSHMRWLLESFNDIIHRESSQSKTYSEIIAIIKGWCLRHPGDISGFSFLLCCLLKTCSTDSRTRTERSTERSEVLREVLNLTVSFKWTHESVWVFLRTLVAAEGTTRSDATAFYDAATGLLGVSSEGDPTIKAARDWCLKNEAIA
jgi:protein prenyltransferase alpha subunit repeat containing protein 1